MSRPASVKSTAVPLPYDTAFHVKSVSYSPPHRLRAWPLRADERTKQSVSTFLTTPSTTFNVAALNSNEVQVAVKQRRCHFLCFQKKAHCSTTGCLLAFGSDQFRFASFHVRVYLFDIIICNADSVTYLASYFQRITRTGLSR